MMVVRVFWGRENLHDFFEGTESTPIPHKKITVLRAKTVNFRY